MIFSFEGLDGVGKTTVIEHVYHQLQQKGYPVIIIREPGSTQLSETIRTVLKSDIPRSHLSEALLFLASRADLMHQYTPIFAEENVIVLIDRFIDSTYAYQGFGNQLNLLLLEQLTEEIVGEWMPKKTFYLTVSDRQLIERQHQRHLVDRAEKDKEYRKRVQSGYEQLKYAYPNRIIEIQNHHLDETVRVIVDKIIEEQL